MHLYEHEYLYPVKITFSERYGERFRCFIEGKYPCGDAVHEFKVETWLDWEQG
jgi:hypothetical protein